MNTIRNCEMNILIMDITYPHYCTNNIAKQCLFKRTIDDIMYWHSAILRSHYLLHIVLLTILPHNPIVIRALQSAKNYQYTLFLNNSLSKINIRFNNCE